MVHSTAFVARTGALNTIMEFERSRLGYTLCDDPACTDPLHLRINTNVNGNPQRHVFSNGDTTRTVIATLQEPPVGAASLFGPSDSPLVAVMENASVQFLIRPTDLDIQDMNSVFAPALSTAINFAWHKRQESLKKQEAAKTEDKLAALFQNLSRTQERDINNRVQGFEMELSSYMDHARRARQNLHKWKEKLRIIQGDKRRRKVLAAREAKLFLKLETGTIVKVTVVGSNIVCNTGPISIEREVKTHHMGTYKIEIPTDGSAGWESIKIWADKPPYGNFQHPHVNENGVACLGNIEQAVDDHLRNNEFVALTALLVNFLGTYNPNSPYYQIDESNYASCLEGADIFDCTDCDDNDCPHWNNRFDRCWQHHHATLRFKDCIECRSCDLHERARQYCERQHLITNQPWNCITCETECTSAGNFTRCRTMHDGAACGRSCPQNECNSNPQHGQEAEDASESDEGG
jgi:hypothetical protein